MTRTRAAAWTRVGLLLAGVVLGVALGPGVLGWVSPGLAARVFSTAESRAIIAEIEAAEAETASKIEAMASADVTPVAITEYERAEQAVLAPKRAQVAQVRDEQAMRWILVLGGGLVLALAADAARMAIGGRQAGLAGRRRLTTVQYALAGGVIAVVLARPLLLGSLPLAAIVGAVGVALLAGLLPSRFHVETGEESEQEQA